MLIFYSSIVVNHFDFDDLPGLDIVIMFSIFMATLVYAMLFAYTSKNLDREIFYEAKGIFELKQY